MRNFLVPRRTYVMDFPYLPGEAVQRVGQIGCPKTALHHLRLGRFCPGTNTYVPAEVTNLILNTPNWADDTAVLVFPWGDARFLQIADQVTRMVEKHDDLTGSYGVWIVLGNMLLTGGMKIHYVEMGTPPPPGDRREWVSCGHERKPGEEIIWLDCQVDPEEKEKIRKAHWSARGGVRLPFSWDEEAYTEEVQKRILESVPAEIWAMDRLNLILPWRKIDGICVAQMVYALRKLAPKSAGLDILTFVDETRILELRLQLDDLSSFWQAAEGI